mmetsp:Transcript_17376/g.39977  ORF Transcript_17376/g.39977 Transcript_17376/m.39977 type:complete len:212 (+) Transcript_17376:1207-1842(+)
MRASRSKAGMEARSWPAWNRRGRRGMAESMAQSVRVPLKGELSTHIMLSRLPRQPRSWQGNRSGLRITTSKTRVSPKDSAKSLSCIDASSAASSPPHSKGSLPVLPPRLVTSTVPRSRLLRRCTPPLGTGLPLTSPSSVALLFDFLPSPRSALSRPDSELSVRASALWFESNFPVRPGRSRSRERDSPACTYSKSSPHTVVCSESSNRSHS